MHSDGFRAAHCLVLLDISAKQRREVSVAWDGQCAVFPVSCVASTHPIAGVPPAVHSLGGATAVSSLSQPYLA